MALVMPGDRQNLDGFGIAAPNCRGRLTIATRTLQLEKKLQALTVPRRWYRGPPQFSRRSPDVIAWPGLPPRAQSVEAPGRGHKESRVQTEPYGPPVTRVASCTRPLRPSNDGRLCTRGFHVRIGAAFLGVHETETRLVTAKVSAPNRGCSRARRRHMC